MTKIIFLGSGGGRFVTFYQLRATGGIYIQDDLNIHIDPGPGSLIQLKRMKLDPINTDLLLVSHVHSDHSLDAGILIEAMTKGGLVKKGKLICSKSVIEDSSPITKYHKSLIDYLVLDASEKFTKSNIEIEAVKTYHNDPSSIGFKIGTKFGEITYISDTIYNSNISKDVKSTRVLILAVTRPLNSSIPYHLNTNDAALLIEEIKPELAVLTHFGLKFLKEDPVRQAKYVETRTGITTIAAKDYMVINMDKKLTIG